MKNEYYLEYCANGFTLSNRKFHKINVCATSNFISEQGAYISRYCFLSDFFIVKITMFTLICRDVCVSQAIFLITT